MLSINKKMMNKNYLNFLVGKKIRLISLAVILLILMGVIFLVSALTPEEELNQLEQELIDSGYEWLINYSVDYPSIEVYKENSDELVTTFENILEENWYKVYLDNLEETEDVFDLKIKGAVEFDYIVDPITTIEFEPPTLPNDTTTTNTSVIANVSITEENLDEFKWNWNRTNYTIMNDSLVLMMNFDNVSALGECTIRNQADCVKDLSGHCYDNETRIMTDEGWKYFNELNENEKVATLNQDTGELEWQIPLERQVFDNNGEMYRIETDEGELVVSEKHRVYSAENSFNCSEICLVEIPRLILNINDSYVQKEISFDKHNATKSSSFVCSPRSCFAFGNDFLYLDNGTNSILLNINEESILNSSSESFDLDNISSLLLTNSCLSFSGANNFKFSSKINLSISPCEINILNNTLASSTMSIYINPSDFSCECIDNLTLFAKKSASFSLNLDLEIISLATENSNSLTKESINLAKTNSNLSLNSAGISTLMFISSIDKKNDNKYINLSDFSLQPITQVYEDINNGKEIYFLNSENKPVKINSIEKIDYEGKIYDVDVLNDIILVERNGLVVWSGNSNHGTLGNATAGTDPTWNSTGKYNGGFDFDGVDDYVNVGSFSTGSSITVETWAYLESKTKDRGVIWKSDMYIIWYDIGDDFWEFVVKDSGGTWRYAKYSQSSAQTGTWVHLVGVWDGSANYIYVNGVLGLTSGSPASITSNSNNIYIGMKDSHCFNGSIDEVRIYNRALSEEEIEILYMSNLNKYDTDKWAFYINQTKNATAVLDEGTYTYQAFAKDESDNENQTDERWVTISTTPPSANKFVVKDLSGSNVASIDENGNMFLKGSAFQSQGSLSPTPNSLIVQDSSSDTVAYFNNTGSLFLLGVISQNSDLSGMTSSNMEFRNSTDGLVAFFDNVGNLKLKGRYIEEYSNP
jgi:hypothetical protein